MQELAKALKGAYTEVQTKIFRNMSQRAATMLKEDMEWMGPVRAQDVDAAQANLVKIVFRLSNNGDILLTLKEDIGKLYIKKQLFLWWYDRNIISLSFFQLLARQT